MRKIKLKKKRKKKKEEKKLYQQDTGQFNGLVIIIKVKVLFATKTNQLRAMLNEQNEKKVKNARLV